MAEDVGRIRRLSAVAKLVWKVVLLAVPVFVALFATLAVGAIRANSTTLDFNSRSALVDRSAEAVDAYIAHLVADVQLLAENVHAADTPIPGRSPDESATIEHRWKTIAESSPMPEKEQVVSEVLNRPSSQYFTRICQNRHGVIREIIQTDARGDLLWASGVTSNFTQRGETWWDKSVGLSRTCASPRDCAYGGDVVFDASVRGAGFTLAVPTFDADSLVSGVLKVVIDPKELRPVLALAAANHPVEVFLIRRNGTNVLETTNTFVAESSTGLDDAAVPDAVIKELATITREQQSTLYVGDEEIPVRALTGPQADVWAVVLRDRSSRQNYRWHQLTTLTAIIVVMFLVSARSYALLFYREEKAQ